MAADEMNGSSQPLDALELEREAVRVASEAGEIFASQPALERSVAWHVGRRLLRYALMLGVTMVLLVIAVLLMPAHRHDHRPSAPPPAIPTR